MLSAAASAAQDAPAIFASVGAQIIAGLCVASLVAIFAVGLKMLSGQSAMQEGQRRTHEALWGYTEGSTRQRGLVEIVRGNGKGDLLTVSERAVTVGEASAQALAGHVEEDNRRWDEIERALGKLSIGQEAAFGREGTIAGTAVAAAAHVADLAVKTAKDLAES